MKRLFLLFGCLFIVCFCSLNNSFAYNLFCLDNSATVSFYCSDLEDTFAKNVSVIQNGSGYIYQTSSENALSLYKSLYSCSGFSLTFRNSNFKIDNLLEKIEVLKQEVVCGSNLYYGYVCGLTNSTFIDAKKVNIQIAVNDNFITIGSPIILGSY